VPKLSYRILHAYRLWVPAGRMGRPGEKDTPHQPLPARKVN